MNVSFEGIGHVSATFATDITQVDTVCKMTANGKVAACEDGGTFCGKVESIRKGFAGVQLHGLHRCTLPVRHLSWAMPS